MHSNNILNGVVASAGSKILITGGYLILHQPNHGIVLGIDAKLHTGIYPLTSQTKYPVIRDESGISVPIIVSTPQRQLDPLVFYCTIHSASTTELAHHEGKTCPFSIEITGPVDKNPFVAKSLHYSLIAISALLSKEELLGKLASGLFLHIRGDRAFYSSTPVGNPIREDEVTLSDGTVIDPQYNDNPVDYQTKTGMGSSAAVVSSLVNALFAHFGLIPLQSQSGNGQIDNISGLSEGLSDHSKHRIYAYRVSQVAHCIAQGKVGSGFDVSTAFFGTQIYQRFSPRLLHDLITSPLESTAYHITPHTLRHDDDAHPHPYSTAQQSLRVTELLFGVWDDQISTFMLPPGFSLAVGDVHGGSETPSMVRKIEQWRTSSTTLLWDRLGTANKVVEQDFSRLSQLSSDYPTLFAQCVKACASIPASEWDVMDLASISSSAEDLPAIKLIVSAFGDLHAHFLRVRRCLSKMGQQADVPVEPSTQTVILDNTSSLPGVLMAGIPGAGGYDALFAIILDDGSNASRDNVIHHWQQWGGECGTQISPLPVDIDHMNGVTIRQSNIRFPQQDFE